MRRRVWQRLSRWSSRGWFLVGAIASLTGCGEPMFDNAGSQHSLLEDREACAMEMEQSPAALAYRQNPTAHPEYVSQVFTDMNRCKRKAITSELAQTGQPAPRSGPKATEALARAVEDRLARVPSSAR